MSSSGGAPATRARAGLLVLGLGTLPVPLDTSVNIALPSFAAAFGLDIVAIKWIVIFYVLTYASLMLVFGRIGDVTSHRRVFQAGLVLTVAGLMACGLATSFAALLAGRVVQGIGASLTLACGPALATKPFAESERVRMLGYYAAVAALGSALGPVLGGIALDWLGWQGVFLMRVPFAVAALALSPLVAEGDGRGSGHLDVVNAALLIATMTSVSLAVGGALGPATPAVAAAAIVACALWVMHSLRSPHPIVDPQPFRTPSFAVVSLAGVAMFMASFAVLLIVPFFLTGTAGLDARTGGLVLAMSGLGAMTASWLAGRLARKVGSGRLALAGLLMVAAALSAIGLWRAGMPLAVPMGVLAVHGLGLGLFQVAASDIVTATLPRSARGVAGSLTMVTRTIGVVAGASLLGLLNRELDGVCVAGLPLEGCGDGGRGAAFGLTMLAAGGGLAAFALSSLMVPGAWRQRT